MQGVHFRPLLKQQRDAGDGLLQLLARRAGLVTPDQRISQSETEGGQPEAIIGRVRELLHERSLNGDRLAEAPLRIIPTVHLSVKGAEFVVDARFRGDIIGNIRLLDHKPLKQRQRSDTFVDPGDGKERVNLLNWDGKGSPVAPEDEQ